MMYNEFKLYIFLFFINIGLIFCRNHDIIIKKDNRHSILLSHFGYYPNGFLYFSINKLDLPPSNNYKYGFTLDYTSTSGISSYVGASSKCMLSRDVQSKKLSAIVMEFNSINKTILISNIGKALEGVLIYQNVTLLREKNFTISSMNINFTITEEYKKRFHDNLVTLYSHFIGQVNASDIVKQLVKQFDGSLLISTMEKESCFNIINWNSNDKIKDNLNILSDLKMILIMARQRMGDKFTLPMVQLFKIFLNSVEFPMTKLPLTFQIKFPTTSEEGDLDLYFHNCQEEPVNISIELIEKNWNSYLSAGDQPLPLLFFIMCSMYLILAIVWIITLRTSEHMVFKIHYLMFVLLIMKALTLFFHAINYYEIGRYGVQEKGWAIMYYITHLLKGALLFTTIILIGAGWAFIKHMLSGKEKKIFIIIIPLQILANIAAIIIDESEESAVRYLTWRNIFLLVDLICCGAILFPVIWSIKHLKEAANIDGKQVHNLIKLRLFRHFYILIICYIYFTRIIVYLLLITVSFKLTWTVDLFRELSTVVFMVVTGYKFRPINNNPYLLVPNEEDEISEQEQLEHALSQSGLTDGVVRLTHLAGAQSGSDEEDVCYETPAKPTVAQQTRSQVPPTSGGVSINSTGTANGTVYSSKL